jgi:hypothetical protein
MRFEMPTMESLVEFRYGGKNLKPGDRFEARDKDVIILKAVRKAKDASPEVPKTQTPPEPKAAEPVVTQALKPEPHDGHENPTEIRVRRNYRRRDMTSEE